MRWPLWRVAVAERSMEPALREGDWLLVRRTMLPGRVLRLRAGQVVVARHPGRPDTLIVKRAARRGTREMAGGWRPTTRRPVPWTAARSVPYPPP